MRCFRWWLIIDSSSASLAVFLPLQLFQEFVVLGGDGELAMRHLGSGAGVTARLRAFVEGQDIHSLLYEKADKLQATATQKIKQLILELLSSGLVDDVF